jgi:hypothetical protein
MAAAPSSPPTTSANQPDAELTEQVEALSLDDEDTRIRVSKRLRLCWIRTDELLIYIYVQACLKDAEELKQQGNDHFKSSQWNEALNAYRSALGRLPKRPLKEEDGKPLPGKGKGRDMGEGDGEEIKRPNAESGEDVKEEVIPEVEQSELEKKCAQVRAVVNANIGACHVKLVSPSI